MVICKDFHYFTNYGAKSTRQLTATRSPQWDEKDQTFLKDLILRKYKTKLQLLETWC